MVFRIRPAISSRKKRMPMTSRMMLRKLMMTQPTLRAMARATRQAPRVMKKAIAFLCLVIRIAGQPLPKYSGGEKGKGATEAAPWVGNQTGWLGNACGPGIMGVELGHLHVARQAEFLEQPNAIEVQIELPPGEPMPDRNGMCVVVVVPPLTPGDQSYPPVVA